ncbi:hypothetical protein [Desulfovibrio litoralis]|uniref:Yip1 domain-containing protein n=1 Tax=Desulfovibrio litoralis DSM 11393 TaxID=1121455 RepID=A0A1M7TBD6_9BACT|nr:hypothetical protein [Desulfovibrio litoralis]SHN68069.1 hypothetical protein SAMN02745728_01814 [Desulfovibrio litoralis DSM 11393]
MSDVEGLVGLVASVIVVVGLFSMFFYVNITKSFKVALKFNLLKIFIMCVLFFFALPPLQSKDGMRLGFFFDLFEYILYSSITVIPYLISLIFSFVLIKFLKKDVQKYGERSASLILALAALCLPLFFIVLNDINFSFNSITVRLIVIHLFVTLYCGVIFFIFRLINKKTMSLKLIVCYPFLLYVIFLNIVSMNLIGKPEI